MGDFKVGEERGKIGLRKRVGCVFGGKFREELKIVGR